LIINNKGTGKTHFLASSLLSLTYSYRCERLVPRPDEEKKKGEDGFPFRVLVTAFTHMAIDHLIAKTIEMQHQMRSKYPHLPELKIARLVNAKADLTELQKSFHTLNADTKG
jgi:hypothetical protein